MGQGRAEDGGSVWTATVGLGSKFGTAASPFADESYRGERAEGRDKSIESAMRTVHSTRHEEGTKYGEAEHKHDAREDHRDLILLEFSPEDERAVAVRL